MAKNIEIQINNGTGYDVLYPKTLGSLVDGTVSSATQLATSRTIRTNLASTSTASFNGSANVTPGVTGTLPVGNGGTGVTSMDSLASTIKSYLTLGGAIKLTKYTCTGTTGLTVNFGSTGLLPSQVLVAVAIWPEGVIDYKNLALQNGCPIWFCYNWNSFFVDNSMSTSYSLSFSMSNYSIKFGIDGSVNAQNTVGIVNKKNWGDEVNYALGIFGTRSV